MSPKVLLITSVSPGTHGVGQLFLRELLVDYPKDKMCCYAVIEPGLFVNTNDLAWLPVQYEERPRETGIWRFGSLIGKLTGTIFWNYTKRFRLPALRKRIGKMAKEQGAELLWVVLSTPTMICIARKLSEELKLPLVVTIWDPPRMLTGNLRFTAGDTRSVVQEFGEVLKATLRCGVASDNMLEEYTRLYGISPVVQMMPAPNVPAVQPPLSLPSHKDSLTIGFGGSFYTHEVWQSLFDALDSIQWMLDGKKVKLLLLATQLPFTINYPDHVTYYGWQPVEQAIHLLSGADALYLPYWFDEEHSEYVRLCFPGKMGTYLKVGKPVLFHGPEASSPASFLLKYPAGICCKSMEKEDILHSLRRFINEPGIYATASRASREAITNELSQEHFKYQFDVLTGRAKQEMV